MEMMLNKLVPESTPFKHSCEGPDDMNFPHDVQKMIAVPYDVESRSYEHCVYYDLPYDNMTDSELWHWATQRNTTKSSYPMRKCDAWVFDQSEFTSTTRSRFNLVCDDARLVPLTYSISMLTYELMAVLNAMLMDTYGRRPSLVYSGILLALPTVGAAMAPNFTMFLICLTTNRVLLEFMNNSGLLLLFEVISPQQRHLLTGIVWTLWSLGYLTTCFFAYVIRDYVKLLLSSALTFAVSVFFYWLIPESPRWLLSKGKLEKSRDVLEQMAHISQDEVPPNMDVHLKHIYSRLQAENESSVLKMLILYFRSLKMVKYFSIMALAYQATTLLYFGQLVNTGSLGGNIYLTTAISGLVDLPGYALSPLVLKRLGRRHTTTWTIVLAGVCNLACVPFYLKEQTGWYLYGAIALATCSRFFSSMAYTGMTTTRAELLPTPVRSSVFSILGLFASLMLFVAPFMGEPLLAVWKPLPSIVYGVVGIAFGAAQLILPETTDVALPDHKQGAETLHHLQYNQYPDTSCKQNKKQHQLADIVTVECQTQF